MADHHDTNHASAMDYKEHEATYRSFLTVSKWSIGVLVVLLVFLYFVVNP